METDSDIAIFPENWKTQTLGEIAQYINGRAFKPSEWTKDGLPIIRIQNLTKSTEVINHYNGEYEKKHLVQNGDLLLAWSASLDVFIWNEGNALLNQHIFNVKENSGIDRAFLFYLLKQNLELIKTQTHGTGMTHITKPTLEAIKVGVPPLTVQKKIASKLDLFFNEFNEAKKQHEISARKINLLPKAILNKAFNGELIS